MGIIKYITLQLSEKTDKGITLEQATRIITISFAALISSVFYLAFAIIGIIDEHYLLTAVLGLGLITTLILFFRFHRSVNANLYANLILSISGAVILYCYASGGA